MTKLTQLHDEALDALRSNARYPKGDERRIDATGPVLRFEGALSDEIQSVFQDPEHCWITGLDTEDDAEYMVRSIQEALRERHDRWFGDLWVARAADNALFHMGY